MERLSTRFPLFSLKEFLIESKDFTTENLISFSQFWELNKQELLNKYPLHIAFYNFVLEIRDSLPYEENNAYHTLLGHIRYLTGNLIDLSRMIVPSEALLVLYQSLANFYLGKYQRAKELTKSVLVILDYSNINLTCYIYSIKLLLDSFYYDNKDLKDSVRALRNLIDTFKDKPLELERNLYILAESILLNFEQPSDEILEFIKKNIKKLDYWTSGICLTELTKYYLRTNDRDSALKTAKEAINSFENIPDNPDRFKPYLLFYKEFKNELDPYKKIILKYEALHIVLLTEKEKINDLNSEESEKLKNFKEKKLSFPKFFQKILI